MHSGNSSIKEDVLTLVALFQWGIGDQSNPYKDRLKKIVQLYFEVLAGYWYQSLDNDKLSAKKKLLLSQIENLVKQQYIPDNVLSYDSLIKIKSDIENDCKDLRSLVRDPQEFLAHFEMPVADLKNDAIRKKADQIIFQSNKQSIQDLIESAPKAIELLASIAPATRTKEDQKKLAVMKKSLGAAYLSRNEFELAITHFESSLVILNNLPIAEVFEKKLEVNEKLADAYFLAGKYSEALNSYSMALEIVDTFSSKVPPKAGIKSSLDWKKESLSHQMIKCYEHLGFKENNAKSYTQAIVNFKLALQLLETLPFDELSGGKINRDIHVLNLKESIIRTYKRNRQYDLGIVLLEETLSRLKEISAEHDSIFDRRIVELTILLADFFDILAIINFNEDSFTNAEQNYNRAFSLLDSLPHHYKTEFNLYQQAASYLYERANLWPEKMAPLNINQQEDLVLARECYEKAKTQYKELEMYLDELKKLNIRFPEIAEKIENDFKWMNSKMNPPETIVKPVSQPIVLEAAYAGARGNMLIFQAKKRIASDQTASEQPPLKRSKPNTDEP